jgi:hypothetical protein
MSILRSSLTCLFLAAAAIAALKFCYFLDQLSIVVADGQSVVAQAGPQLVGASIELRNAAREQRTYYKATGKALAIDMIQAGRLIEHADAAIQHLDSSAPPVIAAATGLIQDSDALLKKAGDQIDTNGEALRLTLAAARGNFEQSEKLWPPLVKSATSLAASGDNVQEATESIRIALEPLRKPTGRLKFILHWLMGLPHISIIP